MTDPDNSTQDQQQDKTVEPVHNPQKRRGEFSPGDHVDNYVIREVLGEGGFAVVYLAEQTKPVRRRVALKVIKPGMDSRQVIARFEAERQALAMMDHPNVARVFDAGTTEKGRPYFVMEHVPGEPITDYCDRHRLTTDQRLDLFIQTCEAVQHAHQKAIIHRDIKPSNALVMVKDGRPLVKVIDFGVAKAIEHRLTELTIYTEQGQLIGTPEYMSPEQAEMGALDIDTRSDIYSLGVLLYELLTGSLPFEPTRLRGAGFAEIQRIIREEEPPKPSTRLSTMEDARQTDVAKRHQVNRRSLRHEIKGDLDWITIRALEKDRTRRYSTADNLADDVRKHLLHEPIEAVPYTKWYRLRRFAKKYRTAIALTNIAISLSLIIMALILFLMSFALGVDSDSIYVIIVIFSIIFFVFLFLTPVIALLMLIFDRSRVSITGFVISLIVVGLYLVLWLLPLGSRSFDRVKYSRQELKEYRQHFEPSEPELSESIMDLVDELIDAGNIDEAEPLVQEALDLRNAVFREGHWIILSTRIRLGMILTVKKQYDDAETMLLDTYESLSNGEDIPDDEPYEAARALADLYHAWDKDDDAQRWRKTADELLPEDYWGDEEWDW